MRPAAASLVLALLLVAAASAAAAGARSPHAEKKHLTKADMALAAAVDLRPGDVGPDWETASPSPYSDGGSGTCPGYDPDLSRFTITGRSHKAFTRSGLKRVESDIELYPSAAQARGDFRVGSSDRAALRRCMSSQFARGARSGGASVSHVVTRLSSLRVGERGLRVSVSLRVADVPVFVDVFVFQRGRAQAALIFTSARGRLWGELALARKLAARMPR